MSITRTEFDEVFDDLLLTTNPRGWQSERTAAYFEKLKGWDITDLNRVCHWMVTGRERKQGMTAFPELSEFFGCRRRLEQADRDHDRAEARQEGTEELKSCDHCLAGYIYFETNKGGTTYEKFAACDCTSGSIIADHIVTLTRRAHRKASMDTVRYSFVTRNEGGISTAIRGKGLMIDPPNETERRMLEHVNAGHRVDVRKMGAAIASPVPELPEIDRDQPQPERWSGDDDEELPF